MTGIEPALQAWEVGTSPEGVFESVPFGIFVAGTAVIEWESILTGRASAGLVALGMPRIVADARDGGLSLAFVYCRLA